MIQIPEGYMREWTAFDIVRNEHYTRYDVLYGEKQVSVPFEGEPTPKMREEARKGLEAALADAPKAEFKKLKLSRYGSALV